MTPAPNPGASQQTDPWWKNKVKCLPDGTYGWLDAYGAPTRMNCLGPVRMTGAVLQQLWSPPGDGPAIWLDVAEGDTP